MIVAVSSNKPDQSAHLWTYENFKDHHNASLIEFSTNGNIINHIIYEIAQDIDYDYVSELELKCEIIEK